MQVYYEALSRVVALGCLAMIADFVLISPHAQTTSRLVLSLILLSTLLSPLLSIFGI